MTDARHLIVTQARRHVVFVSLFGLGVAVRVITSLAYQPALLFTDSFGYLHRAAHPQPGLVRPGGYSIFLWPVEHLTGNSLVAIAVLQHVLGLALALALYALLVRRGVPLVWSAIATVPVLFDQIQLVLEQYVLSDVLFETLLVAGCIFLVWRRRPTLPWLIASAVSMSFAGLVRGAGVLLLASVIFFAIILRVGWRRIVATAVIGVAPLAAYAIWFHQVHGQYSLSTYGPRFLYTRIAPVIHCAHAGLPSYEQKLCPPQPVGHRPSSDFYMWNRHRWVIWHLKPTHGLNPNQLIRDFDKRVLRYDPQALVKATALDLARGFGPSRRASFPAFPARHWYFHDHYWSLDPFAHKVNLNGPLARQRHSNHALATFLAGYGRVVYTPGPLIFAMVVAAAAAVLGLWRSRWSGHRIAVGVLGGMCMLTVVTSTIFSGPSWRYLLPEVPLMPAAAVLAGFALLRGRQVPVEKTERVFSLRTAVLGGVGTAVVLFLGLVGSGWVRAVYAAPLAVLGGAATAAGMVRARRISADVDVPIEPEPDAVATQPH